jgi:RNA recognition motif-containing protein
MSKKLFVGGLSWGTTDEGLRQAFERFGEVTEAKVIVDRETGRSRGFGFVTFKEGAAADQAIQQMDGAILDARTINVNEARERTPRAFGGGGGWRGGGGGREGYGGNAGRDGTYGGGARDFGSRDGGAREGFGRNGGASGGREWSGRDWGGREGGGDRARSARGRGDRDRDRDRGERDRRRGRQRERYEDDDEW